ncbi:hypothetical protein GRI89_05135 [Altererythrobacter salegens]|uniref:Transmembrane anchor protein n=1 Tax=Croceibacterium salegens TaxID=1737568 RepID=A0A6I4SSG2_9SPHN|nr:hypothetical protein [Croceibacterium salegens]MXO58921.1 hypothetical protein [Croceibacterium salegens]
MTEAAPSRKKVIIGGAVAVIVAAAIVVVFVMPAEFGKDPTGLGKALGLSVLSEEPENIYLERGKKRVGVLAPLEGDIARPDDVYTLELGPFESGEFKYTLAEGDKMRFEWAATGPVDYDMHSHPFEGGVDLTESYSIEKAPSQSGVYTAQFSGIHGWYWQNRTTDNVTVMLKAAGPMTESTVFSKAGEYPRALVPPAASDDES